MTETGVATEQRPDAGLERTAFAPLFRSASALLINSAVTSALGFLYWIVVARLYPTEVVGESSALISTVFVLSVVAQLNLSGALVRFLPRAGGRTRGLMLTSYAAAVGFGVVVSLAAVPVLRHTGAGWFVAMGGPAVGWYVLAVLAWCVFALQDSALVGLRQAIWVPVENCLFGLVKILLVVVLAGWSQRLGIFASWSISMVLALVPVNLLLFRRLVPVHAKETAAQAEPVRPQQITRFVAFDYLGVLLGLASVSLLPILVATRLGARANGYFYVAWVISSALEFALLGVGASLTAEGARHPGRLAALTASLIRRMIILGTPALLTVALAAPLLLRLFGGAYGREGTTLLRLLAAALVPRAVIIVWMSAERVRRRMGRVLGVSAALSASVLGLSALLLDRHGITGVGIAYLTCQAAVAVTVAPGLLALVRGERQPAGRWARVRRPARPASRGWTRRATAAHAVALAGALVLWALAVPRVDPDRITDYGLVPALPLAFFLAACLLTASFCVAVWCRGAPTALLALHVVALIVVVHGTLPLVYDSPRYAYLYKHVGVIDYILRHGGVDRSVDIYQNWPGFFALGAMFTRAAGFRSPLAFVSWAQVFFNLTYLAALLFVFRSVTSHRRLTWLAIWFFFAANWVGQDYFAPQALGLFLYLVLFGVALRWLRPAPPLPATGRWRGPVVGRLAAGYRELLRRARGTDHWFLAAAPTRRQRAGWVAGFLFLFTVAVVSHQLTPLMAIVGVTLLVVVGHCRPRALPLAMTLLTMGWFLLAYRFLANHFDLLGSAGQPFHNLDTSIVDLFGVSAGRVFVATTSRALTGAVWLMALVGGVRRVRRGYWDVAAAVLAASPFLMVAAQAYGGEMLFRAYLFSLPWMAFFAAAAFYPGEVFSGASWRTLVGSTLAAILLFGGLTVAYYGLERSNHIRSGEVDAAHYFYRTAPAGSLLMLTAPNFPARLAGNYDRYIEPGHNFDPNLMLFPRFRHRMLGASDVGDVADVMAGYRTTAYLMLSKSQVAHAELFGLSPHGAIPNLERALLRSPRFRVVYRNQDATLLQLRQPGPSGSGEAR